MSEICDRMTGLVDTGQWLEKYFKKNYILCFRLIMIDVYFLQWDNDIRRRPP